MAKMIASLRRFAPWFWLAGLILLFAAERILTEGMALRLPLLTLGAVGLLTAFIVRLVDVRIGRGSARRAALSSLVGYSFGILGVGVALFITLYPTTPGTLWAGLATALWLVLIGLGTAIAFAADWARSGALNPDDIEWRRVQAAAFGMASFTLAVAWVVAANIGAARDDFVGQWSENARLMPSAGTLELAANLNAPVELAVFVAPESEIRDRVAPYFTALNAASDTLKVATYDHAVEPRIAERLQARRNGLAYVAQGEEKRRVDLGIDEERSKKRLKSLDRNIQEALLKVTRTRRTLYRTVGHGERGSKQVVEDHRPGTATVEDILRQRNVTVRDLGLREGGAMGVPPDAAVVMIWDPVRPFMRSEVDVLIEFYRRGGALLLALEPGTIHGLERLLQELSIAVSDGVVMHPQHHMRRSGGASDGALLISNRFGAHPVMEVLQRVATDAALLWVQAGGMTTDKTGPSRTTVLVRPMPGGWLDLDGDRARDEDEGQVPEALAMAATLPSKDGGAKGGVAAIPEGRALVFMDGDIFADGAIANAANLQLWVDGWLWLAHEDAIELRVTASVADPPLVHTRDQDMLWFWTTIAGMPLLVFGMGLLWVRRRRRKLGRKSASKLGSKRDSGSGLGGGR